MVSAKAKTAKVILSGKLDKAVKLKGIAATKGARAAIEAAGMNVRINAATLEDNGLAQRYLGEWKSIQGQAMLRVEQVLVEVEKRAQLA